MITFIKKMFNVLNGNQMESDLMSRAMDSALQDKAGMLGSTLGSFSGSSYPDDIEDLVYQSHMDDQMLRDMHDPYLNPGQDIVVDEVYHGIDHGSDHHY
ncbi:hypothetical protein ACFSCZ_09135 [Siminovitchia sediminis]|uniref:Uncharacterized protein n=1 Tax=Siminovitchia sediminis TaxID=1274353 RepID=A0ABW4KH88_9BACI